MSWVEIMYTHTYTYKYHDLAISINEHGIQVAWPHDAIFPANWNRRHEFPPEIEIPLTEDIEKHIYEMLTAFHKYVDSINSLQQKAIKILELCSFAHGNNVGCSEISEHES